MCRKTHDLALKADFEMASKSKNYYYEFDVRLLVGYICVKMWYALFLSQAFEHLTRFISETDQKIEISKKKLAEQQAEISAEVKEKVWMSLDHYKHICETRLTTGDCLL